MTWDQALILGIVQGITEFLPVSSSGHLILVPELFGWEAHDIVFDGVVHLATLGAVVVALSGDMRRIVKGVLGDARHEEWGRLGWMLLVATLPAVLVGLALEDVIETIFRSPLIVAASLAGWGILLWIADSWIRARPIESVTKVGWRRSVLVGMAQAIALIPGTSRSGVTITAGLFTGMDRETAARFSFLLSVPVIAGAGALAFLKVADGSTDISTTALIVGFFSAFGSGFIAIRFLLNLMKKASYRGFAIYRILLAVAVVALVAIR